MITIEKNIVDWLKVLAALAVLLTHYGGYAMTQECLSSNFNYLIGGGLTYLGPVAIFFFLSGYGLMESEKRRHLTTSQFVGRRLSKVYVPVLIATALWLPVYLISINTEPLSVGKIMLLLTVDFADGALWFIKSLLLLYIAFHVFTLVQSRNTAVGVLVFFGLTALAQLLTHEYIASFSSYTVMMFFIGAISSRFARKGNAVANVATMVLAVYAISGYMIYHSLILLCNCLVLIALTIMCNYMSKRQLRLIACPSLLLALSFDIYLTHYKLLSYISNQALAPSLVFFLALSIAAALMLYILRTRIATFGKCLRVRVEAR